jgi:GNAT superfamily N-acetyltransferase
MQELGGLMSAARMRGPRAPRVAKSRLRYEPLASANWAALVRLFDTPRIERSRNLKPFDVVEAWSVTCLFIAPAWRDRSLSTQLLRAAADYALAHGARVLEGYPVQPRTRLAASWIWTGVVSSYERAGFVEVHRRSDHQPILRRCLRPRRRAQPAGGGRPRSRRDS